MKANEFVKEHSIAKAKMDLACLESGFITKADFYEVYGFDIDDLERLVESWELVESKGGLKSCKQFYPDDYDGGRLKQAIADVEQCQ